MSDHATRPNFEGCWVANHNPALWRTCPASYSIITFHLRDEVMERMDNRPGKPAGW